MTTQYIIVAIGIGASLAYVAYILVKTLQRARRCDHYQCAGCPLSTTCHTQQRRHALSKGRKASEKDRSAKDKKQGHDK